MKQYEIQLLYTYDKQSDIILLDGISVFTKTYTKSTLVPVSVKYLEPSCIPFCWSMNDA